MKTATAAIAIAASVAISACQGAEARRDEVRAEPVDTSYAFGAFTYARYCALCHGTAAQGYAADHAPSLKSPTFLASATDEFLVKGIGDGRPGTAMAPYSKARGGPLNPEEITAIVGFLRADAPPRAFISKAPVVGDAENGSDIYVARCQPCHGTRTERATAVHLANTVLLSTANDAFLRYAIVHGRPETPMPSFDGVLSGTEIDDVVAMLRGWATPPPPPRRKGQVEPPPLGQFVINPKGKTPEFQLRDDRFVPNADVKRALDDKKRMIILDARATSDWFTNRIPGSISVPYYAFDRLDAMPRDGTWILAYCACPHHASGAVVDELKKRGYAHTAVLDEGILAWKKAGFPIESDPDPTAAEAPPKPAH